MKAEELHEGKMIIAVGIVVGCLAILGTALYALGFRDFLDVNPGDTARISEGLLMVRSGSVDMYLVQRGEDYVAFDAGASAKDVRDGLKRLGVDPRTVKAFF